MNINQELKNYITNNIFPMYNKNEEGHGINHILYVINRSLKFAESKEDINYDMVYTIAAYHDCGHYIDHKNHETISAQMLINDKNLLNYFTIEQIKTMKEAVEDHRASLEHEPRSIYGKIVSSADRNTNIDSILERTYAYRKKHNSNNDIDFIIEDSKKHIIEKFGKDGYANEKMYFDDPEYNQFLKDVAELMENEENFITRYKKVNNIN
ncbi:MAG: HD domain-containing protein [Bacilli bacterium]|nr:HD domain-containing protein [Bacilli bacterium]MDD4608254.1 HD domain-containing protein [Bacilli bacterium]